MQFLIIDYQRVLIISPAHIAGRLRPVKLLDRIHPFPPRHDAHPETDADIGREPVDRLLKMVQHSPVVFLGQAVYVKAVCFDPACDSLGLREKCKDLAADHPKDRIPASV